MGNKYKKIKLKDGSTIDEHRLVMEQHLGRKLTSNEVVHHKDGDKFNNSLDNLEVMSRAEHSRMHMTGRKLSEKQRRELSERMMGTPGISRKFSEEDIINIWNLIDSGVRIRQIARQYRCAHSRISEIKSGKAYKWMVRPPVVAGCLINTEINETGSTPVPSTIDEL
jgi:HNH endonuclease